MFSNVILTISRGVDLNSIWHFSEVSEEAPVNSGKTLFAQLMDFLPWTTFTRIVARYGGDQRVRTLSCAEHYRAIAFAQLTYRESLDTGARSAGQLPQSRHRAKYNWATQSLNRVQSCHRGRRSPVTQSGRHD